jgi:hypothetical protein
MKKYIPCRKQEQFKNKMLRYQRGRLWSANHIEFERSLEGCEKYKTFYRETDKFMFLNKNSAKLSMN